MNTFKCTRCGNCCRKPDGVVYLSPRDITRLCVHLHLSKSTFLKRYTRRINHRIALAKKPDSPECVFLSGNSCTAYSARPDQCRLYPFFPEGTDFSCTALTQLSTR